MIYLIGVDHVRAQRKIRGADPTDCQRKFRTVVELAIQSIHPCLLAEEDHPDFLSGPSVPPEKIADSILLEVARSYGMENLHRFVDPNDAEREKIDYRQLNGSPYDEVPNQAHEIAHQFPKREAYWLKKLQDFLHTDIVFVCGWGHIESFQAVLAKDGIGSSIRARAIGILPSKFKDYQAACQYIKDHPTEFNKPNCFCNR